MSRPILCLAPKAKPQPQPQRGPSFSLMKKAIRLFKGRNVPKEVYRRNARKWLAANASLGERHLLLGGSHKWGQAGDGKGVSQIHAPRRLGQRT